MWHKGYLCCVGNQDCIYLNFQTRGIGAMCAFTKSGKEKSRKRFAHGRDMRSSATACGVCYGVEALGRKKVVKS